MTTETEFTQAEAGAQALALQDAALALQDAGHAEAAQIVRTMGQGYAIKAGWVDPADYAAMDRPPKNATADEWFDWATTAPAK